jgi:hypothetical protein
MSKLVKAVEKLKVDMTNYFVGISDITVVPSSYLININEFASMPIVVLQGPRIIRKDRDYEIRSIKIREESGTNINELTKARAVVDLTFRLRIFAKTLAECLNIAERVLQFCKSYASVMVSNTVENITFELYETGKVKLSIDSHEIKDGDSIEVYNSSSDLSLDNEVYESFVIDKNNVYVSFDGDGNSGTCDVTYIQYVYDVLVSEDFTDDMQPNFSDVKQYESLITIEDIEVETSVVEEAYESKGGLNLDLE